MHFIDGDAERRERRSTMDNLTIAEAHALELAVDTLRLTTASIDQLRAGVKIVERSRTLRRSHEALVSRFKAAVDAIQNEIGRRTHLPDADINDLPLDHHRADTEL
jgi:hypothetical protein